ncbi:kinase-like domain-containing protein [Radiomyces spectabilis]|uniref:kinase-like domain-containing protein n=1 Tax=Radiomyces spectabilis TaxID=64574 RepID=UPI00221F65C2|nr:kinase-like domain-containing protein [Radiomyces spectabilis]KAI8366003.1 kinase-like domain-containing protein [Radiomyces spectabilis]
MSLSSLSNALPPTPSPTDKVDHGIPDKPDRHSHHRKHLGPYDLLETLGMGEFGKVRLAVHRETGQQVAVKVVKKRDVETASRRDKIDREISVLNILRHPHIIKLLEVIETESSIGIIMQYAEGGELFEYLYKRRRLGENEAKRLFAQLISSVHYMHEKKIVHRDLKLENLLLDKDLNIIVSDFGFANQLSHNDDLLITSCGSPCYAAPELVVNDGSLYSGFPVDVWSCGVILYAMVCGFLPFDDDPSNPNSENINLLYRYILSTSLTFPDWVSPQLQELLRDMLAPMPQHRSSLESILVHPWLEDYWYLFKKSPQQLEEEAEATIQSLKVPHEPNPSAVQEPLPTLSHEIEKANNQPTMEATLGGLDTVQEKSEKSGSTFDPTDTGNQKPPPSAVHISATSPPPSTSVRKSRLYNMLHHKRSANRASYHSENDADYNDQTHPNNKDSARRQKKAGTLKTKFLTGIRGICSPQPLMERKQENRGTWRTSKSFRLMKRKSPVSLEQTFSSQGSDSPVDFTIPMTPVDRSFANCDHPDGPPKSFTCEERSVLVHDHDSSCGIHRIQSSRIHRVQPSRIHCIHTSCIHRAPSSRIHRIQTSCILRFRSSCY